MTAALHGLLREVHAGEVDLEQELHVVADRHRTDHEIRHVAVDLARWSLQNREALEPVLARFGKDADTDAHAGPTMAQTMREKTAELLGRREETGLLLLRDLRHLHLMAEANSVLWTMLGQAAQATHDSELLEVVTACHERTIRQSVWANGMLKVLTPQVLSAV
jgi:hypothetical protein